VNREEKLAEFNIEPISDMRREINSNLIQYEGASNNT